MVVKVYVSEYSGNFDVKKHQQRVETVLQSVGVRHQLVDVCAPEHLEQRLFMQETARPLPGERHPLPPQIYNEQHYCGDYFDFDYANETGQLLQFLRLEEGDVQLPVREQPASTSPQPTTAPRPASPKPSSTPAERPGPSPSPSPEPETKPKPQPEMKPEPQPPRALPQEPWQIDKSQGECMDVDKEA
ncbi:SH3 domain-binding glutamic acid-rich-like protein 2 isoform X2 [Amphibalanus amphitrite]|uniref:SH3 domain-binding glutamic acid-rich-like protein 2 isoform X2 n=1 Tax=Amphibalanus amphitrite TaxID=1232801 RepID=UPI001C9148FE|nr:SH3 domain-binding glutamic acid-rich-like protein 2 isoform X2 [Amphibalanus amphitrite]